MSTKSSPIHSFLRFYLENCKDIMLIKVLMISIWWYVIPK